MGQYYRAAIIDEKNDIKFLVSYDYDNGAKLMEHSWIGNDFANAALAMIHNQRKRIAWIGDYASDPYEGSDDYYAATMSKEAFMEYYRKVWSDDDTLKIPRNQFSKADLNILKLNTTGTYLINHDNREYIDFGTYIRDSSMNQNGDAWCVNPLPLLTACGNNRGGGDFYSDNVGYKNVGIWAFALLEYTTVLPVGYRKANYIFREEPEDRMVAHAQ